MNCRNRARIVMVQRGIILSVVISVAGLGLIAAAEVSTRVKDACVAPRARTELVSARRSLDEAVRQMNAALSGGSLYAAAKVAAADPEEVERARARQTEAFERLERARAACAAQVAA